MLAELESEFTIARDRNDKIVTSSSAEASRYIEEGIYDDIRSSYHRLYARLLALVPKTEPSFRDDSNISMNHTCNHSDVKLSRIELPSFSGAYEDWMAFYNLFTATIDNNTSMDPVVKLQRLKSALTGDAELIVKNLELNASNYGTAKTLLFNRYQHTRRLVNSYLKKLYELPPLKSETSKALRNMINTLNDCCSALKQLKVKIEDYQLVFHMCRKLPQSFLSSWEESQGASTELPDYKQFYTFLETRFRMLEMIEPTEKAPKSFHVTSTAKNSTTSKLSKPSNAKGSKKNNKRLTQQAPNQSCIVCQANHRLGQCESFLNLPQSERYQAVKTHKSCVNCLNASHTTQSCWSTKTCRVCHKKHHTLLHRYDAPSSTSPTDSDAIPNRQTYHVNSTEYSGILLGTAQLNAINPNGCSVVIRALIDPCSEDSYILSSTVQTLRLKKYYAPSTIGVLGDEHASDCSYRTDFIIKSMLHNFEMKISAGIVDKITSQLPSTHLSSEVLGQFDGLSLADSTFNVPGCINMLLGVEVHTRIRLDDSRRISQDLIAENTLLGYLIRGKASSGNAQNYSNVFMTKSSTAQLSSQIQKFWEIEEVSTKAPEHPDDALCEQIFLSSISQDSDGSLSMDLPFKENSNPTIGPSRPMAVKRFLCLEKKLKTNPRLKEQYHQTIQNYLQSNFLQRSLTVNEKSGQEYYLPHHAVVKDSSSTTKVRVVFDASCKSLDGTSLNDHLLTGKKLQKDIRDVLFNWRQYRFAITGDIEKMYLMFKINAKHHNYQKIVWRFSEDEPIQDFVLNRATFGTSSAPFLAMRALHYIADIYETSHPTVAEALRNEFYVDDCCSGGFSILEAREKQTALRGVLHRYNLTLRKWSSNEQQTLSNIPSELLDSSNEIVFDETEFKKTLGIFWSKQKDAFFFSINPYPDSDRVLTKRKVLSLIARLYDPLGWVSPCTMLAKNLMQKIWQTKTNWDDVVEEPIYSQFKTFLDELPLLRKVSIPRWTEILDSQSPLTIFGFCDASDKGYSAVVYLLRPQNSTNSNLTLLTSKTKVADLKFQSTARLELSGALLLSELMKWTVEMYKPRNVEVIAFCDSQIVLAWLQGHPSRWKTYVANRTSQILEWMEPSQWHYIDTKINPADCASRGLMPSELITHELWLQGPPVDELNYTQHESLNVDEQKILDDSIKKNSLVLYTAKTYTFELLNKFSNHDKLVRVVSIITTFIRNILIRLRDKSASNSLHKTDLSTERFNEIIMNMNYPEWIIFRCIQRECYVNEFNCIQNLKDFARDSKLKGLSPFIDAHGLMRVGGRLQNSELTFAQKHPIILPQKHQVVINLIKDAHEKTIHGSELLTIAYLRQRFHIPRVSQKVRDYIHSCMICFRFSKKQQEVLMGSLPKDRVTEAEAFEHSGVDYAGPITTKAYPGRCKKYLKSYIALFVCLCTKALHLEAVSELSSKAFLAAFKRFVATRGPVQRMYSDNGTNFVGASRILQSDVKAAEVTWKSELDLHLNGMGTEWHFIPPSTPHFGGLWEAGVKSVKMHLNKTIGDSILTFEELTTVLKQIEAVLNSRPLCKITDHPNEFNFLTPGHFLVRRQLVAPPEKKFDMDRRSYIDRWNHLQISIQRFAKLWKRDYLNNLQSRPKGLRTSEHYRVGDLVLLTDEDVPPTTWPTLIVHETHPGTDNVVRVVTLRSPTGKLFKRPVAKLRRLPCNSSYEL